MDFIQGLNNAIHPHGITGMSRHTHRTHLIYTILSTLWCNSQIEEDTTGTRLHFSPLTTEVFLPENYFYFIVYPHKSLRYGAVFLHNHRVITVFSSSNYERELNFCSLALFRYAPPILVASTLLDIIVDTTEDHGAVNERDSII